MRITGLFKLSQPKRFDYKPRYYSKLKEEREERNRRIKEDLGIKEDKPYTPDLRGKLTGQYINKYHQKKKMPIYRMVIIIVSLIMVVAILYFAFYLSAIMIKNA